MKRLNTILNTIIGAFVGVFIGHGFYTVWNYKTHPELYAMQSAPWYTSILVYGVFTIVVLVICFVIKAIIKHKQKKIDQLDYLCRCMLWLKNMNETKGTRRETGVFLWCKINLRKFQSDLLAIFFRDKYNKTIKYR